MRERYDRSSRVQSEHRSAAGGRATGRRAPVLALLVAAAVVVGAAGCVTPVTREAVRDNYRKALVASGEDPDLAKCVTDRFFEHRSNAEVRAFQKRAHLTADETAEFAGLAALCRTV